MNNTNNIINNTTRHNHNNCEHNVIEKVLKHMKHISHYATEINYHSKESLNKEKYCNFFNYIFNVRLRT